MLSELKMTIDGFSFQRKANGCTFVNGGPVYRYWEANLSQKDAVLAAQKTYHAAIREQVEAEIAEERALHVARMHNATTVMLDAQDARREFDNL